MEDLGSWLTVAVDTTVKRVASSIGRPLRLDEVHQIVVAIAERIGRECRDREQRAPITQAATDGMLAAALRKGAPADEAVALKRKRPLSNSPGAIRMRKCRALKKEREKRCVEVVKLEIGEQHVDALEAAGHYSEKLERIDPTEAIAAALIDLLDAIKPSKE